MKEAEEKASTLEGQMSAMLDQMSSLLALVETLKAECTKAYENDVSFVVSSLKTQAEKLDMTVPYFTLMRAFLSSQSKVPPLVPHNLNRAKNNP